MGLIQIGLPLADIASEIETLSSTPDTEQDQEETVHLQPDEQETHHDCSTQTEAFDHLYQSVASLSVRDCPRTDDSTQTEEFDYFFTQSLTSIHITPQGCISFVKEAWGDVPETNT